MARKKRSLLAPFWIPTKDRKQIAGDEKVAVELSDRERDLIMKHTFAGDELTDRFAHRAQALRTAGLSLYLG
jgi:hypothetical protein